MISTLPDDHINKQNTPLSVIVQCPVTFSVIACSSVVFIGTVVSIYANFLFRLPRTPETVTAVKCSVSIRNIIEEAVILSQMCVLCFHSTSTLVPLIFQ